MTERGLNQRFAELDAYRKQNWAPENYDRNLQQRLALVDAYHSESHAQSGDIVAPFSLLDAKGHEVTEASLLANGPAVLIFYRFGGCPACNIALPYYQESLWPVLQQAGIPLVAISPQAPVDTGPVNEHKLGFPLLSDPDYTLARALGITFFPKDQPQVVPGEPWIGATLGTNSYEMTQPAVIILNEDASIRFIDVSPDWLIRTESETILAEIPEASRDRDRDNRAA